MIEVVFLIRSLHRGGSERQLTALARLLDRRRFRVTVITFYSGGPFERELMDGDVRLISLGKRSRWDLLRAVRRLAAELRAIRPDIVHAYLVEPNLLALALKPLFPSTKVVWGIRASRMDLARYDWFARVNFRLQAFAARFADRIIVNSQAGRDYHVARGFPAAKCLVIPSGVDTARFKPDRAAGKAKRQAWGIGDDTVLVGLVGRLDPMKDHRTFLEAAALVAREDPATRFVCVGGGAPDEAAELRKLADEYRIGPRVTWAGECDDMPDVYNALDIACSASSGEGFPNAIGEAMACGVPCVVTDVGDSAILVGNTGIVVPPNDPQALAEGLSKCKGSLRLAPAANPRSRIEHDFDVSALVDRTEAALASLVHTRGTDRSAVSPSRPRP
jgi:glycosyltransferase involved in cell wall biosynthesis